MLCEKADDFVMDVATLTVVHAELMHRGWETVRGSMEFATHGVGAACHFLIVRVL